MLRAFVRIESLSGLRSFLAALGACLMAAWVATAAVAAPPWATLVPFKKIDADPSKNYELEEKHGPWMIMAARALLPGGNCSGV